MRSSWHVNKNMPANIPYVIKPVLAIRLQTIKHRIDSGDISRAIFILNDTLRILENRTGTNINEAVLGNVIHLMELCVFMLHCGTSAHRILNKAWELLMYEPYMVPVNMIKRRLRASDGIGTLATLPDDVLWYIAMKL